jgi:hypothetical protein
MNTETFTYKGTDYTIDMDSAIAYKKESHRPAHASYLVRGKRHAKGWIVFREFEWADGYSVSVMWISKLEKASSDDLLAALGDELVERLFGVYA